MLNRGDEMAGFQTHAEKKDQVACRCAHTGEVEVLGTENAGVIVGYQCSGRGWC